MTDPLLDLQTVPDDLASAIACEATNRLKVAIPEIHTIDVDVMADIYAIIQTAAEKILRERDAQQPPALETKPS